MSFIPMALSYIGGGTAAAGTAGTAATIAAGTATVATAAATGMMAYSSYQQGKTAKKVGKINQALENKDAARKDQATEYGARLAREKAENEKQRRNVLFAKSNIVYTGTPVEINAVTAGRTEMDIRVNTATGRYGATQMRNQGILSRFKGVQEYKKSMWNTGATLLSGAAQIADYRNRN